jgi:HK97 gp10 family phage protein
MAKSGRVSFGSKAIEHALEKYGDYVLDEVRRIVKETAYRIHAHAVALAPSDDGNLKDSIEVTIFPGGLTAEVTVGVHYAIFVEFGTGIYAVEGNGRKTPWVYYSDKLKRFVFTRGMKASPFWMPAIDIGQRHFKSEFNKLG